MLRYIDDISSIFRVSSLPDIISINKSQMKEKSKNIDQYQRYIAYISVFY